MGVIAVTLLHWKKNGGFVPLFAQGAFSCQQLESPPVSQGQYFDQHLDLLAFLIMFM